MYEEIKEKIKKKKPTIDEKSLTYFTNYFYILIKDQLIPQTINLGDLIDNALQYASKIEFYDSTSQIYHDKGPNIKGYRDPETKTIWIRNDLEEPLREITVYHELHHATQTNPDNNEVGINQKSNIGRLIMEAQTQYLAEKVYSEIHQVEFEEKQIPTENLRMTANGIITSKLHNYEMYDNLLSKLAIILNVSKDYFISINFLYKNNEGLNDLEKRYNIEKEKYKLPYDFETLLLTLDYIYCVDLLAYINNPNKQILLNYEETIELYEIHPNKFYKLSLNKQRAYLNQFDVDYFLALINNHGPFKEFAHYIVDNEKRSITKELIELSKLTEQPNAPKKRN